MVVGDDGVGHWVRFVKRGNERSLRLCQAVTGTNATIASALPLGQCSQSRHELRAFVHVSRGYVSRFFLVIGSVQAWRESMTRPVVCILD